VRIQLKKPEWLFYSRAMQYLVEHIGIAARDPIVLKEWYVRILSAKVLFQTNEVPPAFFIELSGAYRLEIYAADGAIPDTSRNKLAGWRHLALRVETIETARDWLTANGIVFSEPIKPAGGAGRVLFFQDPEGNLLHLVERPASFLPPGK
jgi:glyoxylase I family protein